MISINDVNLTFLINGLVNGHLVNVYWFFIPLFCIYLVIPLFANVVEDTRKNIFIYLTSLAFIFNILFPFIFSVFNLPIEWGISIAVANGSLFYTLTGYLLHKNHLKIKYRWILYLLSIAGLLMHIIGTYELSIASNQLNILFKGYNNLPAVLYSLGIFVLIKYDLVKLMKFNIVLKLVNIVNSYSFGIYLIHWYILKGIIKIFNIDNHSIIFRLFAPFIIIFISMIIIFLIRKIPLIKKIVP